MDNKLISFVLVTLSALIMGTAEGKILTMNRVYPLVTSTGVLLFYMVGVGAYLWGLMRSPDEFVKFIAVWEFIAILSAMMQPLLTKAVEWDNSTSFYAVMFLSGIAIMVIFGEKLLEKFGV